MGALPLSHAVCPHFALISVDASAIKVVKRLSKYRDKHFMVLRWVLLNAMDPQTFDDDGTLDGAPPVIPYHVLGLHCHSDGLLKRATLSYAP